MSSLEHEWHRSGCSNPRPHRPQPSPLQRGGATGGVGRTSQLSGQARERGPLSYQWVTGARGLVNFRLPGGTAANFTTSALNDTTSDWVRVSNPCGSVNSQTATVNVSASAKPAGRR